MPEARRAVSGFYTIPLGRPRCEEPGCSSFATHEIYRRGDRYGKRCKRHARAKIRALEQAWKIDPADRWSPDELRDAP